MKKSYSPKGQSCKVTFTLPPEVKADTAAVCGNFNDWDATQHPMKRNKDGSFTAVVALKPGRSYRFRYLLDGARWENDWAADEYAANQFGTQDSVINL